MRERTVNTRKCLLRSGAQISSYAEAEGSVPGTGVSDALR